MRSSRIVRTAGLLVALLTASLSPAAGASHMLWVVPGASNTVYLVGSLHLMKPEGYPLPECIEAAFRDSAVLVTEIDLASLADSRGQAELRARGQLPAGKHLAEVISTGSYAAARSRLAAMGAPAALIDTSQPWLAAMSLTVLKLKQLGYDPANGIDAYFDGQARRQGKPVLGLETAQGQFALFDGLSASNQEALLDYTVGELDLLDAEAGKLVTAWGEGNTVGVESILLEGFAAFPHLEQVLLTDRNRAWAKALEPFLRDSRNYFVVVGVAHLVGAEGLAALLRKQGYAVRQN